MNYYVINMCTMIVIAKFTTYNEAEKYIRVNDHKQLIIGSLVEPFENLI